MISEHEWNAYLGLQLDEPPLPEADFTAKIEARLARRRRFRHWALIGAPLVAGAWVIVGWWRMPAPPVPDLAIAPSTIVALLLLVAVCGFAWIGSESGPAPGYTRDLRERMTPL